MRLELGVACQVQRGVALSTLIEVWHVSTCRWKATSWKETVSFCAGAAPRGLESSAHRWSQSGTVSISRSLAVIELLFRAPMNVFTRTHTSRTSLSQLAWRPGCGVGVPTRVALQLFSPSARCSGLGHSLTKPHVVMSKLSFSAPAPGTASEPQEGQLALDELTKLVQGDGRAWKKIYDAYYPRIKRHITYMIHRADLGEDLAQDVFVQAMKSIKSFEGRSSLSTWIFSIANRLVYKHWRSAGRRDRAYSKVKQGEPEFVEEDLGRAHLSEQRAQALREVLTRLPDTLREAFILVDVQQLDASEAAIQLGISKGNLAVRASRARVKIREELEKDGWIESTQKSKEQCS